MDLVTAQKLKKGKLYQVELTYSEPTFHVLLGYLMPEVWQERFFPNQANPNVLVHISHNDIILFLRFMHDSEGVWIQAVYQDQVVWVFVDKAVLHEVTNNDESC